MAQTGISVFWNYPEMGTPIRMRICTFLECTLRVEALRRVFLDLEVSPTRLALIFPSV